MSIKNNNSTSDVFHEYFGELIKGRPLTRSAGIVGILSKPAGTPPPPSGTPKISQKHFKKVDVGCPYPPLIAPKVETKSQLFLPILLEAFLGYEDAS